MFLSLGCFYFCQLSSLAKAWARLKSFASKLKPSLTLPRWFRRLSEVVASFTSPNSTPNFFLISVLLCQMFSHLLFVQWLTLALFISSTSCCSPELARESFGMSAHHRLKSKWSFVCFNQLSNFTPSKHYLRAVIQSYCYLNFRLMFEAVYFLGLSWRLSVLLHSFYFCF